MSLPAKQPKRKICKNPACAEKFTPRKLGQSVCSHKCALAIKDVNQDKARKALAQVERREIKARKEKLKSRGDYAKEAQSAINAYVRLRDADQGCVSCDKPSDWNGQWHASHFRSVGSSPHLRFDLANIHKACSVCNNHLSGNIIGYRPELIRRIGLEAVEALEADQATRKHTIDDLKSITAHYRALVRELKRAAA